MDESTRRSFTTKRLWRLIQPTPEILNNLGNISLQRNQFDDAIAYFQRALLTNPDDVRVHNNLGVALTCKGQFAEAILQFQEVVRLEPSNSGARENLAKVQAMARQASEQK